jgi:hypothetical protein
MSTTHASNRFAEGNCLTCGLGPDKPWRLLNADGSVRFGCVDSVHAPHADQWHATQAPLVEARKLVKS